MPKPQVTGVAPKEGYPGTKIIIRGEFLGKNENDLVAVKICGVDCTLRAKWERESRITTYTGFCAGKGDITVITASGGVGTSLVGFQGLVKKNIGATEESCIWVDENVKSILTGLKRNDANDKLHDNPLRISVDESSKLNHDYIDRMFPNTSIDITKDNFNATRFLLENYQTAKFESLKTGLSYLKANVGSKTANSSDNLLKTNISSFMDAIKIMKDIHSFSSKDSRNDFTKKFETQLVDITGAAHIIYDQDIASKEKADVIRNSLQILDTYKVLIYFPKIVDKLLLTNKNQEDYEAIISNYKNVIIQLNRKEIRSNNQSKLFNQIKKNVNDKIFEVQKSLLDKLSQFPTNPDDQKLYINYFNTLKMLHEQQQQLNDKPKSLELINENNETIQMAKISPAWYCIEKEKNWLINLMIECRDKHMSDEKVSKAMRDSDNQQSSKTLNEKNKEGPSDTNKTTTTTTESNESTSKTNEKISNSSSSPHERSKFIKELCEMFYDMFADFWTLGSMYLNNKLTTTNSNNNDTTTTQDQTSTTVQIQGQTSRSNQTQLRLLEQHREPEEFYELVDEIFKTFSNIVRAAMIPHIFIKNPAENAGDQTNETVINRNVLLKWPEHDAKVFTEIFPHCLHFCRMCAMQVHSLEIPTFLFETIQNLVYDIRCESLKIIFSTPILETGSTLGTKEEDWNFERNIDDENNSFLITILPLKFELKATKALMLTKEFVLDDKRGERSLFRDKDFINTVSRLLYNLTYAYILRTKRISSGKDKLPSFIDSIMSEKKLLLCLYNNLILCKKKIFPNIWTLMTQHKYKRIEEIKKVNYHH
jgi:hypothetical protein